MTPKEILKSIIDNDGSCRNAVMDTCCKHCPISKLAGDQRSCYSYVVFCFGGYSEGQLKTLDDVDKVYKELAEKLYIDMIVDDILCEDDIE